MARRIWPGRLRKTRSKQHSSVAFVGRVRRFGARLNQGESARFGQNFIVTRLSDGRIGLNGVHEGTVEPLVFSGPKNAARRQQRFRGERAA